MYVQTYRCSFQKSPFYLPFAFAAQFRTLVEYGRGRQQVALHGELLPAADELAHVVVVEHHGVVVEPLETPASVFEIEAVRVLYALVVQNEFRKWHILDFSANIRPKNMSNNFISNGLMTFSKARRNRRLLRKKEI